MTPKTVKVGKHRRGDTMCDLPTKQEFEAYEDVRESGRTNMFDARTVSMMSGLDRKTIFSVMKNYDELCKLYPNVRK